MPLEQAATHVRGQGLFLLAGLNLLLARILMCMRIYFLPCFSGVHMSLFCRDKISSNRFVLDTCSHDVWLPYTKSSLASGPIKNVLLH